MPIDLSNYNTVPERLTEFKEKHPEGSLQSEIVELPAAFAESFIAVKAYAYRTPDDPRPGCGLAFEPMPGKTSYTKDSELQNAETSAWGRAIVAALAADTRKGIATGEDIRNRSESEEAGNPYRVSSLRTNVTAADVAKMSTAELTQRLTAADLSPNGTLAQRQEHLREYLDRSNTARKNTTGESPLIPDQEPVTVPATEIVVGDSSPGGAGACAVCGVPIPLGDGAAPGLEGVETDDGRLIHAGCAT